MPEVEDKRRTAIDIRRSLGDLPISKDVVVTTPEEIERRGHVVGSVLHSALREGRVVYDAQDEGKLTLRMGVSRIGVQVAAG